MRISEWATATGYAWEIPAFEDYSCITLDTVNEGNFTTGYQQFVFSANDAELTCNETITLT